jgi:hypothetical protein
MGFRYDIQSPDFWKKRTHVNNVCVVAFVIDVGPLRDVLESWDEIHFVFGSGTRMSSSPSTSRAKY